MSHDVPTPNDPVPFESNERHSGVLVGFDGSDNATSALYYGAGIALRRGIRLTVATTYRVPIAVYANLAAMPTVPENKTRRHEAEIVLDMARKHLAGYPGEVDFLAEDGDSVEALVWLSETAQVAVLGARGRGGFLGRILGSVSTAFPGHAKCPTIIVPHGHPGIEHSGTDRFTPIHSDEPVVVGFDDSSESRIAALQAARTAEEIGTSLHLMIVLPPLGDQLSWYPELSVDTAVLTGERRTQLEGSLHAEIEWLEQHFPSLQITGEVTVGDSVALLAEASATSQLTVVGSRGRGPLASALLGSTSRSLLHRAKGPVMVVPFIQDSRTKNHPNELG